MLAPFRALSYVVQHVGAAITAWISQQQAQAAVWTTEHGADEVSKALRNSMRFTVVLPFASAATRDTGQLFLMLNQAVYQFVNVYLFILFLRYVVYSSLLSSSAVHLWPVRKVYTLLMHVVMVIVLSIGGLVSLSFVWQGSSVWPCFLPCLLPAGCDIQSGRNVQIF